MTEAKSSGRIVSFYSFKGGVGRTMALANVAFLAAMNELRVLVMDWDLEAPGLHHYFRGLLEPDQMAELRSAPGILDLAWEWRNGVDQALGADEIDRQFEFFRSGSPFKRVVRRVYQDEFEEGYLDIIPAGGDMVAVPEPVEYERALAAMSWNELIDRYAGGGLIDALRQWSSSNYDLILVDSRTGLADVAGICTMQLPDAVVLSFVLNRQNIEGVARVASAIRRNRGDELKIWSVPMRVSREGTDEEADATARALRELTRPGRLDRDSTERDLKALLIKAEPNVPFMESLSVFNDTNAALDPLTANIARLASEIVGRPIGIPEIAEQWRDLVSSRLAPTLSTDAYLRQLLTAEPERASRQLHGYVESAISTLVEGDDLADDYVATLAETAIIFEQRSDVHLGGERTDVLNRTIVLLRKMYERDPASWHQLLIAALESSLDSRLYWLAPEDETLALEEIDELLATEVQTLDVIERRVEKRMRAARLYEAIGDPLQSLNASEEALALIKSARQLPESNVTEWKVRRLDALLQRSGAHERLQQPEEAQDVLRKILRSAADLGPSEGGEGQRFTFDASVRLMRLLRANSSDPKEVASLALVAIRSGVPNSPTFLSRIPEIAEAVLTGPSPAKHARELLERAVLPPAMPRAYAQLFGRATSSSARVIEALGALLAAIADAVSVEEGARLAEHAVQVAREATVAAIERTFPLSSRATKSRTRQSASILPSLVDAIRQFIAAAEQYQLTTGQVSPLEELQAMVNDLESRSREATARPLSKPPHTNFQ